LSQHPFSILPLRAELQDNLASLEYHLMTPIQHESLPVILEGKDLIAQGKTGSGKTAAFGLGVLQQLDPTRFHVQTLVLCPTRELADQVAQELRRLARQIPNVKILTLCGGQPLGPQIGSLEHGAHIVVGTPGRIEEHLRKGTLRLDRLQSLVLDEADRMLEMGFQPAVDAIVEQTPNTRQTLLFSATYPREIEAVAARILRQPVRVEVASVSIFTALRKKIVQRLCVLCCTTIALFLRWCSAIPSRKCAIWNPFCSRRGLPRSLCTVISISVNVTRPWCVSPIRAPRYW
jgi:ATP-independent RNA helicase DbpA